MKKVICFLLVVSLMFSVTAPVFAEEFDESLFASIPVEYSDALGTLEPLPVMVEDGHVYAEAFALAERLGYICTLDESHLSISVDCIESYQKVPFIDVVFAVDGTEVYYSPPGGIYREYTAPYPCKQNDQGTWIPLQYALVLLGGNSQVFDDALYIRMPEESVLSISSVIATRGSLLSFDWEDDFRYSEFASNVTDSAARVVTLFNGLLEFDGRSWSSFVDWNAFDKKFGKSLAAMFCSYSSDELMESTKDLETMLDVFSTKGKTGEMLRSKQLRLDSDVTVWKDACSDYLKKLEAGSGSPTKYNLLYQQYERALDDQLLFSRLGGEAAIEIQDKISSATNVLEAAKLIGYGVSYLSEYQQKDAFMLSVLRNYLTTRDATDELSDATANAMLKYVNKVDGDILGYGVYQFMEEHALEVLVDKSSLDVLLGAPANIMLLAWDIMSSTIPFYDKGLESVEHREISNYAQQVQNDAYKNMCRLLDQLRPNDTPLTTEQCVQLAEYCYVYLKACYIARESAIKSLDGISEEAMNRVSSKIQAEENVNDQIVQYLSVLSRVNAENECYILGFLPENNDEYLKTESGNTITEEWVANNSNHRRLSQINMYDSDSILQTKEFIYYNERGQRTNIVTSYVEGNYDVRDTFVYNSEGLLSEYHFESDWGFSCFYSYNSNGQMTKADTGFGWEWYEYDSAGNLITIKESYDAYESVTSNYYNSDKLLSSNTEYKDNDGSTHTEITTYTYDSNNRLSQEICEGGPATTSRKYDYSIKNLTLQENLTNGERDGITAYFYDAYGNDVTTLNLHNPVFYIDDDGYLAKIVDRYTFWGSVTTEVYEFFYDNEQAVPQDEPISTTIALEAVAEHTYEDVEELLYEYLSEEFGEEGLEVWHQSGNKFQMTISGNPGPIYIINWYLVDMDTGIVRNKETDSIICDLW